MGIPRFYRWLSERYPLINENITAAQVPEFDNFYLDMNGIIHNCSHNNTGGLCVKEEDDVFVEVFKYITRLFCIVRPKKLLYMAVDGCAPRAKMNQQRSRRFRAANDAREAREKAEEMGEEVAGTQFDSNCITPGTEFMYRLTEHLRFFVMLRIQEDPTWQNVEVVVSGPDAPGEGEHKIMDYIRTAKAQPGYSANLRHCLYGLDADLIMLSLTSHEPHFALLREEVVFGKQVAAEHSKDRFQLLHVSLLREYLELEFLPPQGAQQQPQQQQRRAVGQKLERIIDDVILFCVLVGNDFLPCLPFLEIGEGGLEDLFRIYKEHLREESASGPWLTHNCGEIDFQQFASFMQRYAHIEEEKLDNAVDAQAFVVGKRRLVGPENAPDPPDMGAGIGDLVTTPEAARVQYYDVKFGMNLSKHEGTQQQRRLFKSYLEGLQWVLFYYFRGPNAASWSWYYPYYHAPMAADLVQYSELRRPRIEFQVGEPFLPFQQLMAVLPANSKELLPECYRWLFDGPDSPIAHYYPAKFEVDVDGVKVPWGGVTLIPFIEPAVLVDAMRLAEGRGQTLSEAAQKRNCFGKVRSFRYDLGHKNSASSTMPRRFRDITDCPVRISDFRHPAMPKGRTLFPNEVLDGCTLRAPGFPTLHLQPLTCTFDGGIKVFQFEARGKSLIVQLHSSSQATPKPEAIKAVLQAPCAQIDFPFVHRGKVIAVHTPHKTWTAASGEKANNPREHMSFVQYLMKDWRRRGLTLDFQAAAPAGAATGAGRSRPGYQASIMEEELCQQPIAEVQLLESSFVDNEGRTQYVFKPTPEYRLFHLVQPEEAAPSKGPRSISERFPENARVVCIAQDSTAFGQAGKIEQTSNNPDQVKAAIMPGLSRHDQEELEYEIQQVVNQQQASLGWHTLEMVAQKVQLDLVLLRKIFGSLTVRGIDIREDVGMNLTREASGEQAACCLPCYSVRPQKDWLFSDLAVEAVREYQEQWPEFFDALWRWARNGEHGHRDFELRHVKFNCKDSEYAQQKLVKYCRKCPWKKLRLVPAQYAALTPEAVLKVQQQVDAKRQTIQRRQPLIEIKGIHRLFRAEDQGSQLPKELEAFRKGVSVGHRGILIRPNGLVPCGSGATVLGVYGTGPQQELELLLDEDDFGASDIHGRAPPMRGLRVQGREFLPISSSSLPVERSRSPLVAASTARRAPAAAEDEEDGAAAAAAVRTSAASAWLGGLPAAPAPAPARQPPAAAAAGVSAGPQPAARGAAESAADGDRRKEEAKHIMGILKPEMIKQPRNKLPKSLAGAQGPAAAAQRPQPEVAPGDVRPAKQGERPPQEEQVPTPFFVSRAGASASSLPNNGQRGKEDPAAAAAARGKKSKLAPSWQKPAGEAQAARGAAAGVAGGRASENAEATAAVLSALGRGPSGPRQVVKDYSAKGDAAAGPQSVAARGGTGEAEDWGKAFQELLALPQSTRQTTSERLQ